MPQLRQVEHQFPEALVVVGVHSPKYPAERDPASVRKAILRYRVDHPVVNDPDMVVWSSYGVRAWPTLMFIDPEGRVIGKHEGEASAEELAGVLGRLVADYERQGLINRAPLAGLSPMPGPETPLAFPGKVLADAPRDRLFIADSGHDRVVVTRLDGSDPWVIGSGEPGLLDGELTEARFHEPQGLALAGDVLYVADRANHAVRRVDLAGRQVTTVAGTGRLGLTRLAAGPARERDLRSPWDVAVQGRALYIAMAGTHQLWELDLGDGTLRPYAGTGRESIRDGDALRSALAQPSDVEIDPSGRLLYFADSETSAVRVADLPPTAQPQVQTLVGTGLFDFGDVDAVGDRARLQHPLGLAVGRDVVYVADSYNHKVKRLYPAERRVESWVGSGEPGRSDGVGGAAAFDEPSGLSLAGDRLYVADTNNHAVRVVEVPTGRVTTLEVRL